MIFNDGCQNVKPIEYEPEPNTGCWLNTSHSLTVTGYPQVVRDTHHYLLHRWVWMCARGEIGDKHVLHKCDTPCCINPDHLFLGTHADNMADMRNKGRERHARGEANHAKLTTQQVKEILNSPESSRKIASSYGVNGGTIRAIRSHRKWKHVLSDQPLPEGFRRSS